MRRFSQRTSLVTLSEINITPLLDLAFVLLIIFVITTPLLEQGMELKLAKGGNADQPIVKSDVHTVEVNARGIYQFDRQKLTIDQIERELINTFRDNPKMVVHIRADENGINKHLYAIIDRCKRNGITKIDLRTEPTR